jgi:hypothetical protein
MKSVPDCARVGHVTTWALPATALLVGALAERDESEAHPASTVATIPATARAAALAKTGRFLMQKAYDLNLQKG